MNNQALKKINQTQTLFKQIIAPLKRFLDLSFGYMIVFKDGSYYTVEENIECIREFVTSVDKSYIFCDRNVTNYFDGKYRFTLWPEKLECKAMEIYHKHKIWNGITISKIEEGYTQLYWFTSRETKPNWRKFFIRNKPILLEFIEYFNSYKKLLFLPEKNDQPEQLFKFIQGFETILPPSEYISDEAYGIKRLLSAIRSNTISLETFELKTNLSPREVEILSIMCHGFTAKLTAQKLDLSVKTVQQYIERIKSKTDLHFKTDLVQFYEKNFYNNTNKK